MTKTYYRVGRHIYCINFIDDKNSSALLPSSEPFKLEEAPVGEPLLFELNVDDSWRPQQKGTEIGQFDCGGNNHGVYRLQMDSPEETEGKNFVYQIVVSDIYKHQCSLLQASSDFSVGHVCLNGDNNMRTFGLNNALMMMYAFASADKQTVLMHASVVRKDGKGYLCLGVSGTGKSTHTSNWLKYIPDADLMNDDNPIVRICDDGIARVFGSPWSGKTPCYRNVEAPIGGFLQLKQAPYNKIHRQSTIEGFASLLPSCSVMKWDRRDYVGTCDTVAKLLALVPTYFLENLPNEEACRLSYETMAR